MTLFLPEAPEVSPKNDKLPPAAATTLEAYLHGYRLSALVHAAISLNIGEYFAKGGLGVAALCEKTGWHPEALQLFLEALASIGLLDLNAGKYTLTKLGQGILPSNIASLTSALTSFKTLYSSFLDLPEVVRSGGPVDQVGAPCYWSRFRREDSVRKEFYANVENSLSKYLDPLLAEIDVSSATHVIDIGGATGMLLNAILSRWPYLRGTLMERPEVVMDLQRRAGLVDEDLVFDLIPGDFFRHIPAGGDLYILCRVLHDWADEEAQTILTNCASAMSAGARLLLIEKTITKENEADMALHNLKMMVLFGGKERTLPQFAKLLSNAGLEFTGARETNSPLNVIEARKR